MDQTATGKRIQALRKEKNLTQKALAGYLGVTDKAVSKWERGLGAPDVATLPLLAKTLGTDLETLLSGISEKQDRKGDNMKNLTFYLCPQCGNMLTGTPGGTFSCCGKTLLPLTPEKAAEEEKLSAELIENDYFIKSSHPMTKAHYVSFVTLVTGDTLILKRLYPEWDLQTRIPRIGHGKLFWYCTKHGLKYQLI